MKDDQLLSDLLYLKLAYFREHHQALAKEAVEKSQTHLDFLTPLGGLGGGGGGNGWISRDLVKRSALQPR